MDFSKIAPYLQDPLVLVGFMLFVGLSAMKLLVRPEIIPQLTQHSGFKILRLLMTYGFIIGIMVILLGFGLKYREISKAEQARSVQLLIHEIESDVSVVAEITKNTRALKSYADIVSSVLRTPRLVILAGLFPKENLSSTISDADKINLFNVRFDWLQSSGLLDNKVELTRFEKATAAIRRTIERTRSTIDSLSDRRGERYRVHDEVFNAELPILRKISIVDVTSLSRFYVRLRDARETYFRVSDAVVEYLDAVNSLCSETPLTRDSLSLALAKERLAFSLLPAQLEKMTQIESELTQQLDKFTAAQ